MMLLYVQPPSDLLQILCHYPVKSFNTRLKLLALKSKSNVSNVRPPSTCLTLNAVSLVDLEVSVSLSPRDISGLHSADKTTCVD